MQAATFRLVEQRVRRNSTNNRPDGETHRYEAGPVPTQAVTWLWSLLTGAWGFFIQRITTGDERQHESRITGAQMVVDHQDNFED